MSGRRISLAGIVPTFHVRRRQRRARSIAKATNSLPDATYEGRSRSTRLWRSSGGFTLIDVLFVVALIGILSGIAIPSLLRGRAAANEASAIASMRTTHTAQLGYMLTCGRGFYASSFPGLGDGPGGPGFLPQELTSSATPIKSGYTFTLAAGAGAAGAADCNGASTTSFTYYATAIPQTPGNTGVRAFAINQGGAIWQDTSGAAPIEPFTVGAGVTPIQ